MKGTGQIACGDRTQVVVGQAADVHSGESPARSRMSAWRRTAVFFRFEDLERPVLLVIDRQLADGRPDLQIAIRSERDESFALSYLVADERGGSIALRSPTHKRFRTTAPSSRSDADRFVRHGTPTRAAARSRPRGPGLR